MPRVGVRHKCQYRAWALGLALGLTLSACALWQPAPETLQTARWSLQTPAGWMRLSTPAYEMLSKDGPYLQYILIEERPLAQGFRFTRRKMDAGMLPHEAARLIVDNLRNDPKVRHFEVVSNEPSTVGGQPGFKLVYTYRDQQGVDVQSVYYGVILPHCFFNLRYTAARRYYFAKDLAAFRQVRDSVRLAVGL